MNWRHYVAAAALLAAVGVALLLPALSPSSEDAPGADVVADEPTDGAEVADTPELSDGPPSHDHHHALEEDEEPTEEPSTSYEDPTTGGEPASWDEASIERAEEAAVEVVTAWASEGQDQQAWWERLVPLLTEAAQDLYVTVPLEAIVDVEITGDPVVNSSRSPHLAVVRVPTSGGDFEILLTREFHDSPWLADRITLPAGDEGQE